MKHCTVCFTRTLGYKCSACNTVYCSAECQTKDWTRKHRRIRLEKEKEDEDLCVDETDPFTQDEFRGMDRRFIIVLDEKCFHLPSIYDWVVNRDNNRNPLTNMPFSDQAVQLLVNTATQRFPLTLSLNYINGRKYTVETTALISTDKLMLTLASDPQLLHRQVETVFQMISRLASQKIALYIKMPDDQTISMMTFLHDNPNAQLFNIFENTVNVYAYHKMGAQTIPLLQTYLNYARFRDWADDELDQMLRDELAAIAAYNNAAMNQRNAALAQIRRGRDHDLQQLPIEGQYVLNININTPVGLAYGTLPVIIEQDDTLDDLETAIRERAVPIMPLPNEEMRFIYAGSRYNRNTRIDHLPNIANNATITVYWR